MNKEIENVKKSENCDKAIKVINDILKKEDENFNKDEFIDKMKNMRVTKIIPTKSKKDV